MTKLTPIPNYETLYAITEDGNVWSFRTNKYLTRFISDTGYFKVSLSKDKMKKHWRIHRLLALTFIPNPENKPHINHIDGNKLNNNISNLEWCTHGENIQHAWNLGLNKGTTLKGIKHPQYGKKGDLNSNFGKKRTEEQCKNISDGIGHKKVICLTTGIIYDSVKVAADTLNL